MKEQYFADQPIYDDADFRRRFRMSRDLFIHIHGAVVASDDYFIQKRDAAGKLGIPGLLKVTAALRVFAYGSSTDSVDENLGMGEQMILKSVQHFCEAATSLFGPQYLRSPTEEDVERLLQENAARGFVGMLGSVDCMHVEWKNCPAAHASQYKGKEKKPTIVLEAWADKRLWIWHCNFGSPGSLNDINILDQSPIFNKLLQGEASSVQFSVNGTLSFHVRSHC